ncbi:MAG: hypothetical protein M3348_11170 [Acidobacteriota bacterium]|nr:hypothetical protein [Acidobacteriota bacterium]
MSSYKNTKPEEYARWRGRDHANLEAIQNLVLSRVARESGVEMPPNVRHLISALQGAHGSGEVAFEEFSRDYLTIGAQTRAPLRADQCGDRRRAAVERGVKPGTLEPYIV